MIASTFLVWKNIARYPARLLVETDYKNYPANAQVLAEIRKHLEHVRAFHRPQQHRE